MTGRILLTIGICLLVAGCGQPSERVREAEQPEEIPLCIIGKKPLSLGATPEECRDAIPAPPDAKDIAEEVGAEPGLEYLAWELPSEESFAAAFLPGKGAVKLVHRVRMENMDESDDAFAAYEKRFGKGTRRKGEGWIEVVYVRDGTKLVLKAEEKDGFVTFNEVLEDTKLDPKVLRKQATDENTSQ